jgi:hypothetical protein
MRQAGVMKRFGQFGCAKYVCDALQVICHRRVELVRSSMSALAICTNPLAREVMPLWHLVYDLEETPDDR